MWNKLFSSVDFMRAGLDASWLRNSVIRNNIANVETPDFKSSDVIFEDALNEALFQEPISSKPMPMKLTREKHFDHQPERREVRPRIVENDTRSMRMDGNNVDIEDENAKLAKNSIQYNTILYKLNSELARLRMAINEGR